MSTIEDVYVVSVAITPLGSFRSSLSQITAVQLGSTVIEAVVKRAGISSTEVDEVYFGNVLQAKSGQNMARQAALGANLSPSTPCTTINKVCASGMKAIMIASQSIMLGLNDVAIAGGAESMSNAPFYLPRGDTPYGGFTLSDSIIADSLTDFWTKTHVGVCTENLIRKYGLTRQQQDEFTIESYTRTANAVKNGVFDKEIVGVTIRGQKGKPDITVTEDEEYKNVNFEKLKTLKPVFKKDGTITAGNASTLSDGSAAALLMSGKTVKKYGVKPLAKIIAFADAGVDPIDFGIAPVFAIQRVLEKSHLQKSEITQWEINEAFSGVALANIKHLDLNPAKVNPNGGAVSLGNPLGCSGARIVNHLAINLKPNEYGIAGICNGGGGASALCLQKL